jgi:hypothetical protein
MLKLTRLVFEAFRYHGLKPVMAQRIVLDESKRIATAIDVVCQRGSGELVAIELKCGYAGDRNLAAYDPKTGNTCTLSAPCSKARDTILHRHLVQLSTSLALFTRETSTLASLEKLGITHVSGCVLYVNSTGSDLHEMQSYWSKRGTKLVSAIA